jgi:hypothetical protein
VLAVGPEAAGVWRQAAAAAAAAATTLELPHADAGGHVVRSTMAASGAHVISLVGSSPQATLFAVYTFAERELGAQFLLSGDVFPPHDEPAAGENREAPRFAEQDITMTSSFDVRGIQPFHDFSSGPDWWSGDDYKVVLTQLAKQKLNFIGLHSYPMQEPLVWVGDPKHLDADGNVNAAGGWPTSWRTTLDSNWGSSGLNTSEYSVGASLAFPAQCYGSPAMTTTQSFCTSEGAEGYPKYGQPVSSGAEEAATFNAAADLIADAFKFGGKLGVLRAVGTEVPLGMKGCHNCHNDLPAGVSHEMALEGAFTRLQRKFGSALDFYWHWTPECGISNGSTITNATVNPEPGLTAPFYTTALNDIRVSVAARAKAQMTAKLASSGWGLGSQADHNSTLFDGIFGEELAAISALTANVGWQPVDPGYAQITKHKKWVIPWL